MTWMRIAGVAAGLVMSAALAGCVAAVPAGAWVIAPQAYGSALEGEPDQPSTDVSYPHGHLTPDGSGGYWTESGVSWLRLDASGETLRRFNLGGEMELLRVRGVAAVTSTELIVAGGFGDAWSGGLYRFDTETMDWMPLPAAGDAVGDVCSSPDGQIRYVEYRYGDTGAAEFSVRKFDGDDMTVAISDFAEAPAGSVVEIACGPDGSVYAHTGEALWEITEGAGMRLIDRFPTGTPLVAVGEDGRIAWGGEAPRARGRWHVDGGSEESRRIAAGDTDWCEQRHLRIRDDGDVQTSPMLCTVQSIAWSDDETLLVSLGTEAGGVIAKVAPPVHAR